ncbi:B2CL2-like protein [Mya arenaria]|uniref:B2CL2-like protein n=1 Tax=Mya arenaria TaxID=6604 RepID=A0ABY7DF69_MYAAR|nr:bcl-2-like protein 2 [Mya arenaria]WAQ95074.1 B2CL2-like protein [Mya arenaria]
MNILKEMQSLMKQNGMRVTNNNSLDMNPTSTRYLVADYLNYRLSKQNFVWRGCPPLESSAKKIHNAMRSLADEFEKRYSREFNDMVEQLHINPDIAYSTFIAVAQELFIDGINWGRIVALFTFGGSIAIECMLKRMEHLVDSIYEWVSTYVRDHLEDWISTHNGWDGLTEFYEKSPDKNDKSIWPSFGKLCIGAAGILALGAIFTQKS